MALAIEKVLIANRAEIALRVVRACRDVGVRSVAVYSEVDRNLRHVIEADEAVAIGPADARQSYLAVDRLIAAAKQTGADAVHPGYGFLSENAEFARAITDAGLTFIGPPADVIAALGDKLETRRVMTAAGVPVVPGTSAITDTDRAISAAAEIGYPVLVKPAGGGGGRGMRVVESEDELVDALATARSEAGSSFGDSSVFIERLLRDARHVEVQILADAYGSVVHVGDRDCSLQRRHQKVVEEGPAFGLSDALHDEVRSLAIRAVRAAKYVNAGTVEFLYDGAGKFYLLEVNTRIQVEHAVSEMISGVDLVAEQLRIASGERLSVTQDEIELRGTAVECRVYAEDPTRDMMPSVGRITAATFPDGPWVREDRCFEVGDEVTRHYDGMLAKVIVWGPDRATALARTRRALHEFRVSGVPTNLPVLTWLLSSEAYASGRVDTGFIERELPSASLPPAAVPGAPPAVPDAGPPAARPTRSGRAHVRKEIMEELGLSKVDVFAYRHERNGRVTQVLVHVVSHADGTVEAVPVSPRSQAWADEKHRRRGRSAEEALTAVVREVLEQQTLDAIFPELGVSF